MKKHLIVIQEGSKECGAACLLSIIRYYKGNYPMNKLVELTNTTKTGTNFYNIQQSAKKIGLSSEAFHINNIKELDKLNTPLLCQIKNKNLEHFVVIYKINKNSITIMDPAIGEYSYSKEEFSILWTGYIMIFKPYQKLPFLKETNYLNKMIIDIIKENKFFVINIILLSIIFTITSCIHAFYLEVVIDHILYTNLSNLKLITFIFANIIVIKCLSNLLRNKLLIILNQKIDCSLILNTFHKILLLPYNYYKNKTTGDMISRMRDLTYLKVILNKIILTVLLDILLTLISSIILIRINLNMFLILLIIILSYIVCLYIFRPISKKLTNIAQEQNSNVNSYLIESISGFETIKGLNMESIRYSNFQKLYKKLLEANEAIEKLTNKEIFIKDLFTLIGILLTNYIGFSLIMTNKMTLGSLVTFNSLMFYMIDPIRNIIDLNKDYYYATNALKRANNMFEVETIDLDKESNLTMEGIIKIKNLSFGYHPNNAILKNINLIIYPHSKVLILGPSATGKTTLLRLLYKYYDVERNHIFVGKNNINDYTIKDIRNNITYISQNEILYTDTIRNNILLDRKISEEEFQKVCNLTYISDIVKDLYNGYDTRLEENGLNISGGQRQRIILARALLKQSKIIFIDEGLNEMDINLERKILKNIFKEYWDKTFIIISHRIENMDLYNHVIKLENGKVLENLTKKGEEYTR